MEAVTNWLISAAGEANLLERSRFNLALFALPNLPLITQLARMMKPLGISCNSEEEILALIESEWEDWDRVVFSGGVLPKRELATIANTGCLINVASLGNLATLLDLQESAPCRIGLRLDFSTLALKGIRSVRELEECLVLAEASGHHIEALHAYLGTEVQDIERLIQHADTIISLGASYSQIREISFGGGFWYNYQHCTGDFREMVDLKRYFAAIEMLVREHLEDRPIRLSWEPGRIVFAGAGFFVTEILEVRKSDFNFIDIYVDSSFVQIPVPKLQNRKHQIAAIGKDGQIKRAIRYEARICGATTLSTDQLIPGTSPLPDVEVGDCLIIFDVGAYGRAGSYNFLGKALPPEILMDSITWNILRLRQRATHLLDGINYDHEQIAADLCRR